MGQITAILRMRVDILEVYKNGECEAAIHSDT